MTICNRSFLLAFVGALAAAGCAYTPAEKVPDKVFVTGSHIPARVDSNTGLPTTTSAVRIYSRDELLGTGRVGDLRAAIEAGAPAVTP